MYLTLLTIHSLFRWLVLATLLLAIYRAGRGYFGKTLFTSIDNKIRHWTATTAHIQLIIGVLLYIKSPIISYYWASSDNSIDSVEPSFFGLYHLGFMLLSIVILTIGSAKAKREKSDEAKFKTILVWFSVALLIIFLAIPWPFLPWANRPYIRNF
ncbi:hypothetical protein [Tunicatimonas pelagia]|uniref:hypothetical protein n=1 Tax=Tunicatimonas pelagia TaxID=931531 RepID=UPI002664E849|nr:hypothetical protein [Tunicatimonas pelagia]WKN42861.1 hypothetical protein P0M28_27880 [Tunicatimonas pelagia]